MIVSACGMHMLPLMLSYSVDRQIEVARGCCSVLVCLYVVWLDELQFFFCRAVMHYKGIRIWVQVKPNIFGFLRPDSAFRVQLSCPLKDSPVGV